MPPVPNHIRRVREAYGLSAVQVAKQIGVTKSALSRWESREREVGDDFKLLLASFFNLPVGVIFEFGYDPLQDAVRRSLDVVTSLRERVSKVETDLAAMQAAS